MPKVFIVVGERSGDRHGAGLMEALRNRSSLWEFEGLGGPQMQAIAGAGVEDWVEEAGVVGVVEVLRKYRWFSRKMAGTLERINNSKPDALVLIDYPGFNLRLAEALRTAGFGGKIIYYISPQVWAWHRGRIPKMAKWLDLMLCIFPFEKELYEGFGLHTEFAGHPLVAWHGRQGPGPQREDRLVGLFPGSRRREISKLFPVLLEAAHLLAAKFPDLKFAVSAASPPLAEVMQAVLALHPLPSLRIETGTVYDLMRRCTVGAVASGTATLEAAILGLPHCLIYKVAAPTYWMGRMVIRVPHLGIVNLLAGREVVRELLQRQCTPAAVAAEWERLLAEPSAREDLQKEFKRVVDDLGSGDAYARAAGLITECLEGTTSHS